MASRKSPLSLKARAIALLAQREHSVAELRRKLLRLAQQRDLQAYEAAREAGRGDHGASGAEAGGPARSRQPVPDDQRMAAHRQVGSFDLDEDRGEGELDEGFGPPHAQARGATPSSRREPPRTPCPQALAAVMDDERQQARTEEVELLLHWLQQRGYLSESRLVESRINARASRYGNLRIRQELKQLGVVPDEEQQTRLKDSELERAREVWCRKFGGVMPADATSRAKQMRFLAARGFSSEVVRRVLRGEVGEGGEGGGEWGPGDDGA